MPNLYKTIEEIQNGAFAQRLKKVYITDEEAENQAERYISLAKDFDEVFGNREDIRFFSAPGRTEVGGNHTDHNHGRVLAAGINLDAVAIASKNDENIVRVKSRGYNMDIVDLSDLSVDDIDTGHSNALVRGMCDGFVKRGYKIGGFDACTVSSVLSGSGLSSSAAFEVLVGTCLNYLYNDGKVDAVTVAQIAQYAENVHFGKPCGLMDQMASSVGGFITIDFKDPENPVIDKVDFDFASCGHALCIVDTKGNHSDLTDEYAAIRTEMESVASYFGKNVLRETDEAEFYKNIPEIREKFGDRAILRAIHFFCDNGRVVSEVEALRNGNFDEFKKLICESGASSYMYNQNVYSVKKPNEQPVALGLAVSEQVLRGKGAYRVHGGGFAGTIQAFVPKELLSTYKNAVESVFGKDSCYVLLIRPLGGTEI
ncbi:MAG: galactokinase [Oscillospiraceae bacterium]|nr:galactokinase [Oscillospiraceae bacterium]